MFWNEIMSTVLTFIVPVRHQENSTDWPRLKLNLAQTARSISAQTDKNWRALVVANEGADLPELPSGFEIVRVQFPPNAKYDLDGQDREAIYDAVRLDKGRRILAGMLKAPPTEYFMIVDDDDFIHKGLVEFASAHSGTNGWRFNDGLVWDDGGGLLILNNDFNNLCGTSLIVSASLYDLPDRFEHASDDFIKTMLGSHVMIAKILKEKGRPLASLPFVGAIYRVGHTGSHSKSKGIIRKYFLNKSSIKKPIDLLSNLARVRFLTSTIRKTYFGL
jgi:hypothetical protein